MFWFIVLQYHFWLIETLVDYLRGGGRREGEREREGEEEERGREGEEEEGGERERGGRGGGRKESKEGWEGGYMNNKTATAAVNYKVDQCSRFSVCRTRHLTGYMVICCVL